MPLGAREWQRNGRAMRHHVSMTDKALVSPHGHPTPDKGARVPSELRAILDTANLSGSARHAVGLGGLFPSALGLHLFRGRQVTALEWKARSLTA